MKTAISLPDELFAEVDRLARRSGRSRSEVYRAALLEYLHRHAADDVTAALDQVVTQLTGSADEYRFTETASRRVLETSEW